MSKCKTHVLSVIALSTLKEFWIYLTRKAQENIEYGMFIDNQEAELRTIVIRAEEARWNPQRETEGQGLNSS